MSECDKIQSSGHVAKKNLCLSSGAAKFAPQLLKEKWDICEHIRIENIFFQRSMWPARYKLKYEWEQEQEREQEQEKITKLAKVEIYFWDRKCALFWRKQHFNFINSLQIAFDIDYRSICEQLQNDDLFLTDFDWSTFLLTAVYWLDWLFMSSKLQQGLL